MPYRETQYLRQAWIWFMLAPAVIMVWFGFIQQVVFEKPFGTNPAPDLGMWLAWLLVGIFLPIFLWKARLVIEVGDGALHYRWVPFLNRKIPATRIASFEAKSYHPILEYRGWGIRYGGHKKGWIYSTSGNKAVRIVCVDGSCFMLGTSQPEKLVEALKELKTLA